MAEDRTPKIGAGHASAMFRQGLAELRGAFYNESNVVPPVPQYGLYGTKTPGEVMQDKLSDVRDPDEQPSILGERMKQAERTRDAREPERSDRSPDRG